MIMKKVTCSMSRSKLLEWPDNEEKNFLKINSKKNRRGDKSGLDLRRSFLIKLGAT